MQAGSTSKDHLDVSWMRHAVAVGMFPCRSPLCVVCLKPGGSFAAGYERRASLTQPGLAPWDVQRGGRRLGPRQTELKTRLEWRAGPPARAGRCITRKQFSAPSHLLPGGLAPPCNSPHRVERLRAQVRHLQPAPSICQGCSQGCPSPRPLLLRHGLRKPVPATCPRRLADSRAASVSTPAGPSTNTPPPPGRRHRPAVRACTPLGYSQAVHSPNRATFLRITGSSIC